MNENLRLHHSFRSSEKEVYSLKNLLYFLDLVNCLLLEGFLVFLQQLSWLLVNASNACCKFKKMQYKKNMMGQSIVPKNYIVKVAFEAFIEEQF